MYGSVQAVSPSIGNALRAQSAGTNNADGEDSDSGASQSVIDI
jgi:hypothetical protein